MEGTTVLEWITAIGTLGATVVALAFGIVAERRSRWGRLERDAEVTNANLAKWHVQANQVAIWKSESTAADGTKIGTIHVLNASDLPIFNVRIPPLDELPGWDLGGLIPGEKRDVPFDSSQLHLASLQVWFHDNRGVGYKRREEGGKLIALRISDDWRKPEPWPF